MGLRHGWDVVRRINWFVTGRKMITSQVNSGSSYKILHFFAKIKLSRNVRRKYHIILNFVSACHVGCVLFTGVYFFSIQVFSPSMVLGKTLNRQFTVNS